MIFRKKNFSGPQIVLISPFLLDTLEDIVNISFKVTVPVYGHNGCYLVELFAELTAPYHRARFIKISALGQDPY